MRLLDSRSNRMVPQAQKNIRTSKIKKRSNKKVIIVRMETKLNFTFKLLFFLAYGTIIPFSLRFLN